MFCRLFLTLVLAVFSASLPVRAGYGFDVGVSPASHATNTEAAGLSAAQGEWMRVRGVVDPAVAPDSQATRSVEQDRAGLQALRARGIKTTVFLRWGPSSWARGVREGGGHRLPLDLRDAYERGRLLGVTYGDVVDVWEIENEPDIDFVAENPETYAAFQKALYLGLKYGASASAAASLSVKFKLKEQSTESTWLAQKRGFSKLNLQHSTSTHERHETLVIMAPLALPPGPYLERLWANGIASYTDGFNYHYYGFDQDFSGVYRQFREAVRVLNTESTELPDSNQDLISARSESSVLKKKWPIFITEYGYGLLDADSRDTVAGRVRQWRWFASVIEQVRELRIAAPMAFYWNPYYEADLNEFGLTTVIKHELDLTQSSQSSRSKAVEAAQRSVVSANSGLKFVSTDFGEKKPQPWMERIGKKVGDWYASPALAYLWDYAERNPYRPRDWQVQVAPPSPVVIDFISGRDLAQRKVSGGYVLNGNWKPKAWIEKPSPGFAPSLSGGGRLVVYNFSDQPITGRLTVIATAGAWISTVPEELTLAAGERREIDVELVVQSVALKASAYRVVFTPESRHEATAVWSTQVLPSGQGMAPATNRNFEFTAEAARVRQERLRQRPLAVGEAGLHSDGRWLVTDGVRVEEHEGVWRFHIDWLPVESLRPAAVELPLPEGFEFPEGTWLMLERRVAANVEALAELKDGAGDNSAQKTEFKSKRETAASGINPKVDASRLKSRAGLAGDVMDVYFRTENGNLFQTWPRLRMTEGWNFYAGRAEDFTMGFFGRSALPWRFSDNKPAALVFYLRPASLPAVFEVRNPQIVKFEEE